MGGLDGEVYRLVIPSITIIHHPDYWVSENTGTEKNRGVVYRRKRIWGLKVVGQMTEREQGGK